MFTRLGHKALSFKDSNKKLNLPLRKGLTKEQMELEAETVNFLICNNFGLDAQSVEYLAGYIDKEEDWSNFSYELVIKVSDRLQAVI